MKTTLSLLPLNGGAFNCLPARDVELDPERILCNDIIFPWESNYHRVGLYVIGNEYGALGAVWAGNEQDALDELVDAGLGDGLLIEEADADEDCTRLGNAGEPANLDNCWLQRVRLDEAEDCRLIAALAEARGAGFTTLDK